MIIVTVSFPSIKAGGYLLFSPLFLHSKQSQALYFLQIKVTHNIVPSSGERGDLEGDFNGD